MDDAYDVVSIGYGDQNRRYDVVSDHQAWKESLLSRFPDEHDAIHKYFALLKANAGVTNIMALLKTLPLWLCKFLIALGVPQRYTTFFDGLKAKSTLEVVSELTSNKDLQTIMFYCWGDYGVQPSKSNIQMQSILVNHYKHGAYYPVGGASEIAFNIIPVIERAGGKVLVRANVKEILHNGSKVMGVLVEKGSETYRLEAPLIVSNAGLYNTFQKLLSPSIARHSYLHGTCQDLKPGLAAISVFVGFNASNEELGLKPQNVWCFNSNESDKVFDDYLALTKDEALDTDAPLMFVSFPSAKDPNWSKVPERKLKSTMTVITMANWEWYKKWDGNTTLKKRGDEYEELKKSVADRMIQRCCQLFPKISDHIDYVEIGSPLSNKFYLAQPNGEIYGLDHGRERFDAKTCSQLRASTDIPGLYLTGQDILSAGFGAAIFTGVFTASAILERNVLLDLFALRKKLKKVESLSKKEK